MGLPTYTVWSEYLDTSLLFCKITFLGINNKETWGFEEFKINDKKSLLRKTIYIDITKKLVGLNCEEVLEFLLKNVTYRYQLEYSYNFNELKYYLDIKRFYIYQKHKRKECNCLR